MKCYIILIGKLIDSGRAGGRKSTMMKYELVVLWETGEKEVLYE